MKAVKNIVGEKTNYGPGKTALYFKNVGLFSDPFLEERLPQLENFYNSPSTQFLNRYWNIDESDATKYNKALQDILNLWHELDQDIPKFCSKERQLQNSWIDKIFDILGWKIELEESSSKHGVTNFPDYTLFASKDDWKASKNLTGNNKFKKATAIADAKAWGVNLDGKGFSNQNPSFQIINYLKQTDKNWGILTDGKYWRIYSLRSESKHTTYYEIDLEKVLAGVESEDGFERFKYFYNFFRAEAFVVDAKLNDRCFLDFVFDDGKFYSQRVESNLQNRVYKVVDSICKGFLDSYQEPSEQDLKEVYEYSMYYLFKLMFVLNCEAKGLLEVNKQDDYYEFSLRKMCMDIKEQHEAGKTWSGQPKTYNHINDLFVLLKAGDSRIGVHGFGEEPFEIGSENFYTKHKIPDEYLNQALLDLACDHDEDKSLQFIDYKILSPDHIGSLFEGLLEFNLMQKGKKIELLNTKGDRKATGSYYTRDYLVDYIVEETISPLINKKDVNEIMKLKILDPAMGSGHFLLGVVKFLEKTIIEIQDANDKIKGAIDFDQIRKEVLKNCVYGVDINSLATQLAKFSLWIYTSQKGETLEPLADQLMTGDSLVEFEWEKNYKQIFSSGGFDAVVGNPPYGANLSQDFKKQISTKFKTLNGKNDTFHLFIEKCIQFSSTSKKKTSIGFIIPNSFLELESFSKIRDEVRNNFGKIGVVDLAYNAFKEAKVDTCLIFLTGKPEKSPQVAYKKCAKPEDLDSIKLDEWSKLQDSTFRVVEKNSPLFKLMSKLDDFFEVCQGTKAYEVGKGFPAQTKQMLDDKVYSSNSKRGKDYKPFLYGCDINFFQVTWKSGEFIKFGENLAAPRQDKFHNQNRVIVQRIRNPKLEKRLVSAYLEDDSIASAGLSILVPKKEFKNSFSMKALCVFLNLPATNDWFKANNNDVNIKPTVLKLIPVDPSFIEKGSVLDKAYEQLSKLAKQNKKSEMEAMLFNLEQTIFKKVSLKKAA